MAKKKRRFIGPTIEATQKGLATAEEGVYQKNGKTYAADTGRVYRGPVSSPAPLPPMPKTPFEQAQGIQPIAATPEEPESTLPIDIQILDQSTAKGAPTFPGMVDKPQTPEEEQTRNIILGYYKATHRMPSPDKVAMLMQYAIPNGTPEHYAALWRGGDVADAIGAGDFFRDSGYENLHGVGELLQISRDRSVGGAWRTRSLSSNSSTPNCRRTCRSRRRTKPSPRPTCSRT